MKIFLRMRLLGAGLVLVSLSVGTSVAWSSDCIDLLGDLPDLDSAPVSLSTPDHQLTSAMQFLRERVLAGELTLSDLQALQEGKNQLASRPDFASQQYAKVLQVFLEQFYAQRKALWWDKMEGVLAEFQAALRARSENTQATKRPYREIHFLHFQAVEFDMGEPGKQVKMLLPKPFELMNAPMTQYQYARLVTLLNSYGGLDGRIANGQFAYGRVKGWLRSLREEYDILDIAPSRFDDGPDSSQVNIYGQPVQMRPDNPVDSVTYRQLLEVFLYKLNKLSWRKNNTELQNLLRELLPGHQPGDIYSLPTEAHQEYVMRLAQTEDGDTVDAMIVRGDTDKMRRYVAFNRAIGGNTDERQGTLSLDRLVPFEIHGQAIYLHGNVAEWSHALLDYAGEQLVYAEGDERYAAIRGSSWADVQEDTHIKNQPPNWRTNVMLFSTRNKGGGIKKFKSTYRDLWSPDALTAQAGFRLMRTRR